MAVLLLLAGGDATGTQLLLNPGFEEGTDGWIVPDETVLTISDEALSGDAAGEMSGPSDGSRILQYAAIQPGAQYRYSGWVFADDPLMIYAWLQIAWYDGGTFLGTVDSSFLVGPHPAYAFLELEAIAPPNANSAQVLVRAKSGAAFSMLLDDLAFELEEAPVTTAPVASTASATTPAVTATTPATPATPTRSPEPTASRTPTPSPVRPSATPSEPKVFSSLVNGGFEEVREDGTSYGWRKIGGAIAVVGSPVAAGSRALEVKSDGTSSTKWAYQTVSISGGRYYVASAMAWNDDADAEAVFLRVSWYASEDGSGEAIGNEDSIDALGPGSGNWRSLATEPIEAPVVARSARVRLMLRPAGEAEAIVYFDSVRLTEVPAPTDAPITATPALPTATRTPTATAPATATPDATQTVTATPIVTASPTPPASPTASPSPIPTVLEPRVFSELVNGGFEVSREDGTPYGWWKVGGEMAVSDSAALAGELGLEVVSRTDVTKWVYQTVSVEPGAWYEAAAWAMNEPGVEAALVRVSWYASETGEGSALASEDSGELQSADGVFHFLSTEAIRAPEGARAAKVRLLVRPASSEAAMSSFDSVSFSRVEEPELEAEASTRTPAPTRVASSGGGGGSAVVFGATEGDEPPESAVGRSVLGLANVHPAPVVLAAAESPRTSSDGVSVGDAIAGALVGFSLVAIGGIFGQDLWAQSKKRLD